MLQVQVTVDGKTIKSTKINSYTLSTLFVRFKTNKHHQITRSNFQMLSNFRSEQHNLAVWTFVGVFWKLAHALTPTMKTTSRPLCWRYGKVKTR